MHPVCDTLSVNLAAESAEHPVLANVVGVGRDTHRPGGTR